VNAAGNVFAKGVYTPAQSGDNSGDNSNNGEQGSEGNGEQGNQGEQNGVTNLEFRGEKPNAQQGTVGAVDDPGTYYYWNDQGWCGSYVTVNQAVIDAEGAVTLDYAYQYGGTWYGMQLFYEDPNTETGKKYTLSLHIDSEYDCNITINGKVIVLSAGANEVTLEYVETDDASLSIQMGVADRSYMEKNTLKIYDVTFTEVKETINESSDGDMEAGENGSEEIGENSSIGD
jgi:hypothetical protein